MLWSALQKQHVGPSQDELCHSRHFHPAKIYVAANFSRSSIRDVVVTIATCTCLYGHRSSESRVVSSSLQHFGNVLALLTTTYLDAAVVTATSSHLLIWLNSTTNLSRQRGSPAGLHRRRRRQPNVSGPHLRRRPVDVGTRRRRDGCPLRGPGCRRVRRRLRVDVDGRRQRRNPVPSRHLSRADRAVVQVVPTSQRDKASAGEIGLLRGTLPTRSPYTGRGRYTSARRRHSIRHSGTSLVYSMIKVGRNVAELSTPSARIVWVRSSAPLLIVAGTLSKPAQYFCCVVHCRASWSSCRGNLYRGATTAEKSRGIEVWVPTPGRLRPAPGQKPGGCWMRKGVAPLPLWGSGVSPPEIFWKLRIINPAFWWLSAVKFLAFLKTTAKKLGTNTLLVLQPKSWGTSLPGPYDCCAYDAGRLTYGPRLSGIAFRGDVVPEPQIYAGKTVQVRRDMATSRNRKST